MLKKNGCGCKNGKCGVVQTSGKCLKCGKTFYAIMRTGEPHPLTCEKCEKEAKSNVPS